VIHLVIDWLSERVDRHPHGRPRAPGRYAHAALHGLGLLLVFPALAALALAIAPVDRHAPGLGVWWARLMSQTTTGPIAVPVPIWRDPTLHVAIIAAVALAVV